MIYQGIPKSNDEGSTGFTNQKFTFCQNGNKYSKISKNNFLQKSLQEAALEVLAPELKDKTLELAAEQCDKPLKKGSALAEALEQVHASGTSTMKVRRKKGARYTNAKRKDADHKKAMLERRAQKVESEIKFEGLFDFVVKHVFTLERGVFDKVVGDILDTFRKKINDHKALMEVIIGIDAHTMLRYVLTVICAIATMFFAYQSFATGAWLPIVMAGLTSIAATYFARGEIFDFAISILGDYLRKHYGPKHPIAEAETDEEFYAALDDFLSDEKPAPDNAGNDIKPEGAEWILRSGSAMLGEVLQGIVVGGVGFAMFNKKGRLVESLAKVPNLSKGISGLIEMLLKWIAAIIDELFGTTASSYFSQNKELDAWAKEVMETATAHEAGQIEVNTTSAALVLRLAQKGRDLAASSMITTSLGHQLHRSAMRELDNLKLHYNRVGLGTESRPEPLGFLMMGESGIGKSTCTTRLVKYVGIRTMPKHQRENFLKDTQSEIYSNLIEEEHANGYRGQFFAILDDLGQQKPAQGDKTEAMVIIRWINANAPRLNMAALHEKGNVSFTSEIILASTNRYTFWDMNIVQPEAFLRRWKRIVIVTVKKEYCTPETRDGDVKARRLDKSLVQDGFSEDVNEFHLQRIVDPAQQTFATDRVLTFREFEDLLVQDYKDNKVAHKAVMDSIQTGAEERLAQVLAEEKGAIKFECGFETEEQMKQAEVGRAFGKKIWSVSSLRKLSWWDWVSQTSFSAKCLSVKGYFTSAANRVGNTSVVSGTVRLTTGLITNAKMQIVEMFLKIRKMSMQEKLQLAVFVNLLLVTFVTFVMPVLMKILGAIMDLFGSANIKLPKWLSKDETKFETMKEFALWILEDSAFFLQTKGIATIEGEPQDQALEPIYMRIIKQCKEDKNREMRFTRSHIDHKVGVYKLEPAYESGFFAVPSCDTVSGEMYVTGLFQHNVYHIYNESLDPKIHSSSGKVMFVKDQLMLINKHFIVQMAAAVRNGDRQCIQFVPHGRPDKVVRVPMSHIVDPINHSGGQDDEDALLINMSPYFSTHKNIIEKFVSNANTSRLRDHAFSVYVPESPFHMKQHDVRGTFADVVPVENARHRGMFWYIAPTKDGDCGGPLIERGNKDPKARIVGIHAAGERRDGLKVAFAQRISCEMLKKWADKWENTLEARPTEDLSHESADFLGLKVVRKDAHNNVVMTKNSLVPSYMHGWAGEPTRIPAVLHPFTNSKGEKKYPLLNALTNENANNVPLDTDFVDSAVHALAQKMLPHIEKRDQVLSVKEGILGVEGTPLKPVARGTSAGYYSYLEPGIKPGKKGAFGVEGDYDLKSHQSQILIKNTELLYSQMEKGIVPDRPYVIFLKVEKRSLKKVEDGNARVVKAASIDDVIVIRRVYGNVVAGLMQNHTISGVAVGINALGWDWDFLARHMQRRGKRIIAGDFAKFDQSQSGQLLRATLGVISKLAGHTGASTKMVEKCITETLAAPRCIVGDMVYENDHGLPSGNPLTSIMNSIFVQLAFRLVWLLLMQEPGETKMSCLKRFDENVTLVSYGDDHLANITDECSDKFNQNTLIAAFPKLGLHYTSDDKEDLNPPDYRTIEEVTFLKRSFRWDEQYGRYMGPLDLQTLKEVCYYSDIRGSPEEVTRDNVERTFRELSLHGREVYESVGSELERKHNERAARPVVMPPYNTALEEVMGQAPGFPLNTL